MWGRGVVKKWSAVELWYLIENYHRMSMEDLCKDMLKNQQQIEEQVHKLSLDKDPHGLWKPRGIFVCSNLECLQAFSRTEHEFEHIGSKFCSNTCSSITQTINRPVRNILVNEYRSGLSVNDIARKYQVSKGTMYNWFKYYDIHTRTLSDSLKEFFKTEKGYSAITRRLDTLERKYGTKTPPPKAKGKYNKGLRADLGISVRSGWEANVLRYLKFQNIEFEYEPKVFIFHGVKKGNLSYLPDIYLPKLDIWIEIKGQLRPGDKVKTKRFKKYYPEEFAKLEIIVRSENVQAAEFYARMNIPVFAYYRDLNTEFKNEIPNWE